MVVVVHTVAVPIGWLVLSCSRSCASQTRKKGIFVSGCQVMIPAGLLQVCVVTMVTSLLSVNSYLCSIPCIVCRSPPQIKKKYSLLFSLKLTLWLLECFECSFLGLYVQDGLPRRSLSNLTANNSSNSKLRSVGSKCRRLIL
jgi:hypothetical protein